MYLPRDAEARLRQLAAYYPAIVVTGARQAGKTTLLRHTFPDHTYVSLDLPSTAELAERDPEQFLRSHPQPVIVDEVQYAPALFRHLKRAIDADRHATGQFLLTGSQNFQLMVGITDSLAGRIAVLELENLSTRELAGQIDTNRHEDLLSVIVRGQFPELWRVADLPAREYYRSYLATYLERDVRQIMNITSLRDFERFIRILASRSGGILNKSDIARDIGVSAKTIGEWLSVLATSGQIAVLKPWFVNLGKRIVKTPKVYFRDTGLLCFLLNLTPDTLVNSPFLGAVWETLLYAELRKRAELSEHPSGLWYYRDQRSREIDFVVESAGRLNLIEAKWHEHPTAADARWINAVDRDIRATTGPWRPGNHYVVGRPADPFPITEGIEAIRVSDLDRAFG